MKFVLDLYLIPKIPHYESVNIPKSYKNLKSETLLVHAQCVPTLSGLSKKQQQQKTQKDKKQNTSLCGDSQR